MGRQPENQDPGLAYIAGFLDGDGSVMVQVKKRNDSSRKWRLMFTICFYQDTRHEEPLFWIKEKLGIGYISHRNDGMTELRINGMDRNREILKNLYPYLKFKEQLVTYVLEILEILEKENSFFDLGKEDRERIAELIIKARKENYQSGSKKIEKLKEDLEKIVKG